jgi:hypothetical protein
MALALEFLDCIRVSFLIAGHTKFSPDLLLSMKLIMQIKHARHILHTITIATVTIHKPMGALMGISKPQKAPPKQG